MKRTVAMAHRLAVREVSVLIQGESGTGQGVVRTRDSSVQLAQQQAIRRRQLRRNSP